MLPSLRRRARSEAARSPLADGQPLVARYHADVWAVQRDAQRLISVTLNVHELVQQHPKRATGPRAHELTHRRVAPDNRNLRAIGGGVEGRREIAACEEPQQVAALDIEADGEGRVFVLRNHLEARLFDELVLVCRLGRPINTKLSCAFRGSAPLRAPRGDRPKPGRHLVQRLTRNRPALEHLAIDATSEPRGCHGAKGECVRAARQRDHACSCERKDDERKMPRASAKTGCLAHLSAP